MRRHEQQLITRATLAAALRKHPDTIAAWAATGMPVAQRGRGGRPSMYDPAAVAEWLAAREAAERSGPLDPVQERARRDHWQAELAQQTHEMRAGQLLPAAETDRAWSAETEAVRAHLVKAPARFADRLNKAAAEGLPAVERELREVAHELLSELAAGMHAKARGARA